MYARIREAMEPLPPDGWCFLVLTLDREGRYSGRPWADAETAFRDLSRLSRNFLARLRRFCIELGEYRWRTRTSRNRKTGKVTTRQVKESLLGSRWVATVEAHRSGWPHVNVLVHSQALAAFLREERAEREARGLEGRELVTLDGELLEHATDVGWGVQSTAEACDNDDAVASYIVKLAGDGDRAVGEVAKLSQLPTMAPERFRRLRAGKGFLPPRRKNPDFTGTLVRRTTDSDGHPLVLPLHKVPEALQDGTLAACLTEERVLCSDLEAQARGRAPGAPGAPPVRRFVRGTELEPMTARDFALEDELERRLKRERATRAELPPELLELELEPLPPDPPWLSEPLEKGPP